MRTVDTGSFLRSRIKTTPTKRDFDTILETITNRYKQVKFEIMNKTDLVKEMSSRMSITRQDALLFINTWIQSVSDLLKEGETISLQGFGSFNLWRQHERMGRNPKTGVGCMIPPRSSVKFKPGRILLKDLNRMKE